VPIRPGLAILWLRGPVGFAAEAVDKKIRPGFPGRRASDSDQVKIELQALTSVSGLAHLRQ